MAQSGRVEGLYLTHSKGEPLVSMECVTAEAEKGIVGDRYHLGTGFYSNQNGWGASVTLIESEAISAINAGHRAEYTGAMLRRNIVTSNVRLESLIGREFQCGAAVLRGLKPYPPCAHLALLLGRREILKYLAYCGGIGAEVISSGAIWVDDLIVVT